ncbi:MAG: hypothetical protein U1F57_00010 [bacterium]
MASRDPGSTNWKTPDPLSFYKLAHDILAKLIQKSPAKERMDRMP